MPEFKAGAEEQPQRVEIDVVSDVVCPWCFVGKRRLEEACALAPELEIFVRWRPYQLDDTIPQGGIPRAEYLSRKFGPGKAADMYARLNAVGAEVGIPFRFDAITRSPNTLDAHRLIRWAGETGVQDEVKERLLNLYFLEGVDVGDHDALAAAAADSGMDAAAVKARLASDEDKENVRADIQTARNLGVTGVPYFVIDGRIGLSGAQPAENIILAIRQALAQR